MSTLSGKRSSVSRLRLSLWLVLALAFGIAPAHAQNKERARITYKKAAAAYDFGEYQKALDLFKDAYAEVDDPAILYNIAQCHRQLGQNAEAVRVYRSFLRNSPNSPRAVEIRELVAKLEKNIAEAQEAKARAAQAQTPPLSIEKPIDPTPPPVVAAPSPTAAAIRIAPKPLHKRWYLWVGVAGGVLVIGAAVGLAVAFTTPKNVAYPAGTMTVNF